MVNNFIPAKIDSYLSLGFQLLQGEVVLSSVNLEYVTDLNNGSYEVDPSFMEGATISLLKNIEKSDKYIIAIFWYEVLGDRLYYIEPRKIVDTNVIQTFTIPIPEQVRSSEAFGATFCYSLGNWGAYSSIYGLDGYRKYFYFYNKGVLKIDPEKTLGNLKEEKRIFLNIYSDNNYSIRDAPSVATNKGRIYFLLNYT